MKPFLHVNLSGHLVDTTARSVIKPAPLQRLKRTHDPAKATHHFGFEVVGVAVALRDKAREVAQEAETAFDEPAWLNKTPSKRALRRVFAIESSALQAADLLRRHGSFLRVEVLPILKAET